MTQSTSSSPTPDRAFVRPLGAMERLFHLYAQEHPRHFCVVAEIAGNIPSLDFQPAFDQVQKRHAMLSAYVVDDAQLGPCIHRAERPLPVNVFAAGKASDWRRIVERELATPFVDREAPLMRATVLRERERASIILTCHHALLDGLSAVCIVGDLLEALCGRELAPLPVIASMDQLLEAEFLRPDETLQPQMPAGLTADKLREIADMPLWRPFEGDCPIVSTVSFDAETTAHIQRRSKAERTTVHGALCAAVVQCTARPPQEVFTIASPVNVRTLLKDVDRHAAFLVGAAAVSFPVEPHRAFWDIARQATDELAFARTSDGQLKSQAVIKACVPPLADSKLACGAMGSLTYDSIVTNMGVVALPTEIGPLRLEAFWGPSVQGRFRDERIIGAATLDGRLRVIQTSPTHIPPFVEPLRDALLQACGDA